MVNRRFFVVAVAALAPLAPQRVSAQGEDDVRSSYLGGVQVLIGIMLWSWQEFARLSEATNATDESWRMDFFGTFAVARAAQEMANQWAPPDEFQSEFQIPHEHLLDAINHLVQAGEHFKIGYLEADLVLQRQFALKAAKLGQNALGFA